MIWPFKRKPSPSNDDLNFLYLRTYADLQRLLQRSDFRSEFELLALLTSTSVAVRNHSPTEGSGQQSIAAKLVEATAQGDGHSAERYREELKDIVQRLQHLPDAHMQTMRAVLFQPFHEEHNLKPTANDFSSYFARRLLRDGHHLPPKGGKHYQAHICSEIAGAFAIAANGGHRLPISQTGNPRTLAITFFGVVAIAVASQAMQLDDHEQAITFLPPHLFDFGGASLTVASLLHSGMSNAGEALGDAMNNAILIYNTLGEDLETKKIVNEVGNRFYNWSCNLDDTAVEHLRTLTPSLASAIETILRR